MQPTGFLPSAFQYFYPQPQQQFQPQGMPPFHHHHGLPQQSPFFSPGQPTHHHGHFPPHFGHHPPHYPPQPPFFPPPAPPIPPQFRLNFFYNSLLPQVDNITNLFLNSNVSQEDGLTFLSKRNDFDTLVSLVGEADLVDAIADLETDGPITILAPTNDAFAALDQDLVDQLLLPENQGALQEILQYHVSAAPTDFSRQGVLFDSLLDGDETILVGNAFRNTITNGSQFFNGGRARVAQNGTIIIPIEQVLIPPNFDPSTLAG